MSEHVDVECCGCGIEFCIPEARHRALRKSHETFYCPNGHSNYYPGKTAEEKRIAQLERQLKEVRDRCDEEYAVSQELGGAARECPLRCGWKSRRQMRTWTEVEAGRSIERVGADVAEHLIREHGAHPAPGTRLIEGEVLDGEVVS